MTTDVHELLDVSRTKGLALFWTLVIVAVAAAAVSPFLPPRVLADTTQEAR